MTEVKLYRAEEVAMKLGISLQTLNLWYVWKRSNPDAETASLIPDYLQVGKKGTKGTRFWTMNDINRLKKFQKTIKKGRNGIMADATQRYVKRKDKTNDT